VGRDIPLHYFSFFPIFASEIALLIKQYCGSALNFYADPYLVPAYLINADPDADPDPDADLGFW
jgi:hypothetical protein